MNLPNVTPLPVNQINSTFAIAPQMQAEHIAQIAGMGFKTVINSRPDFEAGPDQPTNASIQAAAEQAGLTYVFIPIPPNTQTEADIETMRQVLAKVPTPILGFCRSGNRVGRLYGLAMQK